MMFLAHSLAAFGAIALSFDLLGIAFPDWSPVRGAGFVLLIACIAVSYGLFRAWPRPIEESFSAPRTKVRILRGDLLDQDGHVVVGTCDTFDTATPNIISANSLQGQLLKRLYGNDVQEMDRRLAEALESHVATGQVTKPGKTKRYPIGTVATLTDRGRCIFLLAYSEMDLNNNCKASVDGLWSALSGLWREVSLRGNGGNVSVPVIGGGLSRISQVLPAQDAIRFLVLSFMLASRATHICDELRIVVRDEDYEKLDRLELQAFLTSLKGS